MTVYSSQGSTVNGDTFILHNTQMDRAANYVAGSRHKDNCHWYLDRTAIDAHNEHSTDNERIKTLVELMSRENQPQFAIDLINDRERSL